MGHTTEATKDLQGGGLGNTIGKGEALEKGMKSEIISAAKKWSSPDRHTFFIGTHRSAEVATAQRDGV